MTNAIDTGRYVLARDQSPFWNIGDIIASVHCYWFLPHSSCSLGKLRVDMRWHQAVPSKCEDVMPSMPGDMTILKSFITWATSVAIAE